MRDQSPPNRRDRGEAEGEGRGLGAQRRLIGIAVHSQTHDDAKTLSDLRPHLVKEIKQFFINYNELRGRKFKPLTEAGPRAAEKLIDAGIKTFKKQRHLK